MEPSSVPKRPVPLSVLQEHPGLVVNVEKSCLCPPLLFFFLVFFWWKHLCGIVVRKGTMQPCAPTGIGLGILIK